MQMHSERIAGHFGRRLSRHRQLAQLSQTDLGVLVEMNHTVISQLERGLRIPRLDTILMLSAGVEAPPGELIAGLRWRPVLNADGGSRDAGLKGASR